MMTTMVKKMMKKVTAIVSAAVMAGTMMISAAGSTFAASEGVDASEIREKINRIGILVNEARAAEGLPPMYIVPYLNELSEMRAEEISVDFSHTSKGRKFSSIIDTDVVDYYMTAENIAAGSSSAEATMDQWANSEKHWAAIMNPDLTHMGIGVYYDADSDYGWYWQQLFVMTDQEFSDQYLPSDKEIVPKADGDINGDGVVNTYDYLTLTDYIGKKNSKTPAYLNAAQLEAADVFKDGIISEADAKVMMRYLLGEYKSLPFVF